MTEEWSVALSVCLGVGLPLLTYIFLSVLFFHKPHLLHKTKRLQKFKGRNVSHRGGGGERLEATLAAFTNAEESGTDVLEFDVRLTSDDVVIVFHDDTLERCCGVSKLVRDVAFKELPELNDKLNLYFKKNHWTEGMDRRIVTMREVLEQFPHLPVMIEIKGREPLLVNKVSEMIKEFDREDRTIWGSESNTTSTLMYTENPNIPLFFSYNSGLRLLLCFYTGLLPFIKLKESVLVAPMPGIELDPENGFALNGSAKVKKWFMDTLFMRSSLFKHLETRGIDTYLYGLNKESEFERAFAQLKITGVLTDFPSILAKYLENTDKDAYTKEPLIQKRD